jgi:tRNA(Ile)-lysidine synthase
LLSDTASPEPGALFSDIRFAGRKTVVAAVSGGGDSLALLFLLQDFLERQPSGPSLLAVTVDHGLRPDSATEARAVGELAAARGIAHRTLRWEEAKPKAGISAAAREARLALLARAAREAGTDLVFTAHTADDQAETLAMRLSRGGGRGAAGIAPATLFEGDVWFTRPLLHTRRAALRTYLGERGISWFEDPSNRDPRFERARVRACLDEDRTQALLAEAENAQRLRQEQGRAAADLIGSAATRVAPGLLRFALAAASEEKGGLYALRIVLAVAGGSPHLADEARSAALLRRALEDERCRVSLSRAVVTRKRDWLYLHRERRNLPETSLSGEQIWDGRYRLVPAGQLKGACVAAFGPANAAARDVAEAEAPAGLLRSALAAEPAIWRGDLCLGLASDMEGLVLQRLAQPWARLLPSFDLAPASALLELLNGSVPPILPFDGHKEQMG